MSSRPKRKVVFQPPFFRGELLNFGGVGGEVNLKGSDWHFIFQFFSQGGLQGQAFML